MYLSPYMVGSREKITSCCRIQILDISVVRKPDEHLYSPFY